MAAIPGVTRAELNFGTSRLTVEGRFDPEAVAREGARHDITVLPEGGTPPEEGFLRRYRGLLVSLLSGFALLAAWMVKYTGGAEPVFVALFLAAIGIGGAATARRAWFSLQRLRFDMNVLMMVAVIGAAAIGEWSEGAVVAFLYSVSNALEAHTMERARQSIRELMNIAPREALVRRDGGEIMLPVDEIRVGDVMIVKPGEKIAMDGRIVRGGTTVDQSAITGESIPVGKRVGDEVFAGTLNREGSIEVEVTRLVHDTTIARIVQMVEEAQTRKAPAQAFVDRFAAVYTPIVLALAAGIVMVPPLAFGEPWAPWIYRGLALLVVSCPCALVVSTPVALVAAIGNAARNGVLIKGGLHLEEAGRLAAVAFDKTGTLTVGSPVVTDVIPADGRNRTEILALAAGIEQYSEHPLAGAVIEKARETGLRPAKVANFQALAGKGARGEVSDGVYYMGSPRLFEELGAPVGRIGQLLGRLQDQGKTAMILGNERDLLGVVAVADRVRESGRNVIRELNRTGVRTVLLTGDNTATAAVVARELGIDEFEAELLPENKVEAVKRLIDTYGKVGMVGDGINDAPALALASVGIAMGGAGTDVALETAGIVLMADDLSRLPFCIRLSKETLKVIKQNVAFALVVKLSALLLAFPGWLTLWLAILADMGASVLVTLNGVRLLRLKPQNRAGGNDQL